MRRKPELKIHALEVELAEARKKLAEVEEARSAMMRVLAAKTATNEELRIQVENLTSALRLANAELEELRKREPIMVTIADNELPLVDDANNVTTIEPVELPAVEVKEEEHS